MTATLPTRRRLRAYMRSSAIRSASAGSPASRTQNSSPPSRYARPTAASRGAWRCSSASPAWWPKASLYSLKPSRSKKTCVSPSAPARSAISVRRLGSPVSLSWSRPAVPGAASPGSRPAGGCRARVAPRPGPRGGAADDEADEPERVDRHAGERGDVERREQAGRPSAATSRGRDASRRTRTRRSRWSAAARRRRASTRTPRRRSSDGRAPPGRRSTRVRRAARRAPARRATAAAARPRRCRRGRGSRTRTRSTRPSPPGGSRTRPGAGCGRRSAITRSAPAPRP